METSEKQKEIEVFKGDLLKYIDEHEIIESDGCRSINVQKKINEINAFIRSRGSRVADYWP